MAMLLHGRSQLAFPGWTTRDQEVLNLIENQSNRTRRFGRGSFERIQRFNELRQLVSLRLDPDARVPCLVQRVVGHGGTQPLKQSIHALRHPLDRT